MNSFMHGHHAFEQCGTMPSAFGTLRIVLRVFDVGALQNIFRVAEAELVADGGHVAGDGAIAEGNQHFRPRADFVEHFQVVLVADGAFDEADIHVFRIFLHVHDRAVDEFDLAGEFDEELVEVEEGHVAAGTAAQPDCGYFQAFHNFFSRALTMNSSLVRSRSISATVEPL